MIKSLAVLAVLVATSACTSTGDLTVTNSSDFTITEMHVTQTTNISWGPNLLAGDVLLPGEQTTVTAVCDTYDVMLVDSTNATCEIDNIDLCLNNADFVITNSSCTTFRKAPPAKAPTAPTTTTN
jgi:hypothetical protein